MVADMIRRHDAGEPAENPTPSERITQRLQPSRERLAFHHLGHWSLLGDNLMLVNFRRRVSANTLDCTHA
jgi:hypothetical protein